MSVKPSSSKAEELQAPTPIAQAKDTSSLKPDTENQRKSDITQINYDIKTRNNIAQLMSKFAPRVNKPSADEPQAKDQFFERLGIFSRIEKEYGNEFIVDVQSDLRFPFAYFIYTTTRAYPDVDSKGFPYVSPASLIAYKQLLLHAVFLIQDIYNRPITSGYANLYKNEPKRRDFLTTLLNCSVPHDVEELILHMSTVTDAHRELETFVPSFAAASFKHDFGRLIPPTVMLQAHAVIASTKTNSDPDEVIRSLYTRLLINFNGVEYTISNLLGAHFNGPDNAVILHRNWLNLSFEQVFNPLVARALTQRPTLARFDLDYYRVADDQDFNPYDYLLGFSDGNIEVLTRIAKGVSNFFENQEGITLTIAQALEKANGSSILSHSIESVTLPTWHNLVKASDFTSKTHPKTDLEYATLIHFLKPEKRFNVGIPPPSEDIQPEMYLVSDADYDSSRPRFPNVEFSSDKVLPDVLWFQPYDNSPANIGYPLALGIKIEQENIDGVVLPLPDIRLSLTVNNSWYQPGSLPIQKIKAYNPSLDEENALRISSRTLHSSEKPPMGVAFREMATNLIPRFARNACRAAFDTLYGLVFQDNHTDNQKAFTYVGWTDNSNPPIPDNYTYLWSSYRYVDKLDKPNGRVHMYYTMRGHYGLNPCLSRTRNPVSMIPQ